MKLYLLVVLIAAALMPMAARADGTITSTATLTNVSGNCLALRYNRTWLALDGTAAAVALGYCLGAGCTAAIGTAGTTTIAAATLHYFMPDATPKDAMCFIATSGSQPFTIREGYR